MKSIVSILIIVLHIQLCMGQSVSKGAFSIGEVIEIESKILEENRTINIYLPHNYNQDSSKHYPVIYLLDGSADEDFIHIAGLVQFCSFSWINIIPETIVVGLANIDRKRDFTYPSSSEIDKRELPTSGKSESFMDFLADELQPEINGKFRVTKERTLIGQSLGGLLATEILFKRPELFENYIIVSPSLWWDDEKLLKYDLKKSLQSKSVYIAVGQEGDVMERVAQSLFYKLSLEKKDELRLYFKYFEELDHGDTLHKAVYDSFEKLFEKNKPDGE